MSLINCASAIAPVIRVDPVRGGRDPPVFVDVGPRHSTSTLPEPDPLVCLAGGAPYTCRAFHMMTWSLTPGPAAGRGLGEGTFPSPCQEQDPAGRGTTPAGPRSLLAISAVRVTVREASMMFSTRSTMSHISFCGRSKSQARALLASESLVLGSCGLEQKGRRQQDCRTGHVCPSTVGPDAPRRCSGPNSGGSPFSAGNKLELLGVQRRERDPGCRRPGGAPDRRADPKTYSCWSASGKGPPLCPCGRFTGRPRIHWCPPARYIVVAGPYRHPEPGVGDAAYVLAVPPLLRVADEGAEEPDVGSVQESSPSGLWLFRCPVVWGSWGLGPSGRSPVSGAPKPAGGVPGLGSLGSRCLHSASPLVWQWWAACRQPVNGHIAY